MHWLQTQHVLEARESVRMTPLVDQRIAKIVERAYVVRPNDERSPQCRFGLIEQPEAKQRSPQMVIGLRIVLTLAHRTGQITAVVRQLPTVQADYTRCSASK